MTIASGIGTKYREILVLCVVLLMTSSSMGKEKNNSYKVKTRSENVIQDGAIGRGNIIRGDELEGAICFTFDDGPDYRTTPILLDQLDKYGIKAAFFINGAKIHPTSVSGEENRVVLREIYQRGHYIGNHTFSHKDITNLSETDWNREIRQVERQVAATIGKSTKIFRPPFGTMGPKEYERISNEGYRVVMWNIDPLDWKASSARQILTRFKQKLEENPKGGIVVMHDTNRSAIEAFPLIVEWILESDASKRASGDKPMKIVGIDRYLQK